MLFDFIHVFIMINSIYVWHVTNHKCCMFQIDVKLFIKMLYLFLSKLNYCAMGLSAVFTWKLNSKKQNIFIATFQFIFLFSFILLPLAEPIFFPSFYITIYSSARDEELPEGELHRTSARDKVLTEGDPHRTYGRGTRTALFKIATENSATTCLFCG